MNIPTSASHYRKSYSLIPYDLLDFIEEYDFGLPTIKTYLYICFHANTNGVCEVPIDIIAAHLGHPRRSIGYAIADLDAADLVIADPKGIIIPDFAAWTMEVKP